MPRTCSVCGHPDRAEIDTALVAGQPFRNIAERFGTSATALFRHRSDHIPSHLARAHSAETVANADGLLGQLDQLQADARRIGERAEGSGDLRTALAGIRELVRICELTAKLRGELDERAVTNILVAPEFQRAQAAIMVALDSFPDAKIAAADALSALKASS